MLHSVPICSICSCWCVVKWNFFNISAFFSTRITGKQSRPCSDVATSIQGLHSLLRYVQIFKINILIFQDNYTLNFSLHETNHIRQSVFWWPLTVSLLVIILGAPSEKVPSDMRKNAQIQVVLRMHKVSSGPSPLHSYPIVSDDSGRGQWKPWSDCANAQADLGLRCPHMPKDTISHVAVHFSIVAFIFIAAMPRHGWKYHIANFDPRHARNVL